jgi:uncharacterized membrane protein YvbJ
MTPDVCPNCGADLPRNARVCPECGSCDETGWSQGADSGGLDLPDDSFDYEGFVEREFGEKKPALKPRQIPWFWWVVAIIVVLAFLLRFIR